MKQEGDLLQDAPLRSMTPRERKQTAALLMREAAEAQRILASRKQAGESLIPFCLYVDDRYQSASHLEYIASKLYQVERYIETGGKEGIGRLIINMPPRHGKTMTVAKRWPAYILGRHQNWRLALVSYAAELSEDASRSVRALIRDEPRFQLVYKDARLSDESQAIHRWALASKSPDDPSVVATGVGGPLTGRGFHLIIIDDPVKGREEAESDAIRKNTIEWYRGTLRTRLEPGGAIVIIMTRWHEDDLVGWLLGQAQIGEGEAWEVVNLPALAESEKKRKDVLGRKKNDALWPERYNEETLVKTRRALGSYDWESQYQGHPKPPAGSKLQREWFKIIKAEDAPKALVWYRYWDLAISTKTSASYTASCRSAFDEDGNLYLASMIRGHWEWPKQRKVLKSTMLAEKALGVLHGVEEALHGTAALQELRIDPDLRGIGLKGIRVHVDKLTRALPFIALAEAGKVCLIEGAWVSEFLDEAAAFTGKNDRFDDQIDAASGGVAMQGQTAKLEAQSNPFYA